MLNMASMPTTLNHPLKKSHRPGPYSRKKDPYEPWRHLVETTHLPYPHLQVQKEKIVSQFQISLRNTVLWRNENKQQYLKRSNRKTAALTSHRVSHAVAAQSSTKARK
ncbi:hypothetical protein EVAR_56775_1 [Eumeta japonica]|uniref:Uncharacterized protein n=1 Tax=Eumeta variegata TaxID=151549 RepID=A0A4C1XNX7_EUMVA|nr:hypothetical protein EVAR_56775_1 [Eumeta japonica]